MRRVEANRTVIVGAVLLVLGVIVGVVFSPILGALVVLLSLVAFGLVVTQSAKATRARMKDESDQPDFPEKLPEDEEEEDSASS